MTVTDRDGKEYIGMVYTMNAPYRDEHALPSQSYLHSILAGCKQNGLQTFPVLEAVRRTRKKLPEKQKVFVKRWEDR